MTEPPKLFDRRQENLNNRWMARARGGGFAPRHLNRSTSAREIGTARKISRKPLYFSCAV